MHREHTRSYLQKQSLQEHIRFYLHGEIVDALLRNSGGISDARSPPQFRQKTGGSGSGIEDSYIGHGQSRDEAGGQMAERRRRRRQRPPALRGAVEGRVRIAESRGRGLEGHRSRSGEATRSPNLGFRSKIKGSVSARYDRRHELGRFVRQILPPVPPTASRP